MFINPTTFNKSIKNVIILVNKLLKIAEFKNILFFLSIAIILSWLISFQILLSDF